MHYGDKTDSNGDELDFTEPFRQEIDGWKDDLIIAGKEIDDLMEEIAELRLENKMLKEKLECYDDMACSNCGFLREQHKTGWNNMILAYRCPKNEGMFYEPKRKS